MVERESRLQIAERDARERTLLGRLFDPRRQLFAAVLGVVWSALASGIVAWLRS